MKLKKCLFSLFMTLSLLLLTGCKTELYSGLQEKEANEMIAILVRNNIKVSKIAGKKETVILMVSDKDMADAITVLKQEGYPKDNYASIGDVFEKKGMISSPLEERARYIYAVSQDIGDTLSRLDGVLDAKVHVVLPETDSTGQLLTPSSASVFIKHKAEFNLKPFVPQFKHLVSNSIEGLDYAKISVALFPSVSLQQSDQQTNLESVLHIRVHPRSESALWFLLSVLILLLISSALANAWFWYQRQQKGADDDTSLVLANKT